MHHHHKVVLVGTSVGLPPSLQKPLGSCSWQVLGFVFAQGSRSLLFCFFCFWGGLCGIASHWVVYCLATQFPGFFFGRQTKELFMEPLNKRILDGTHLSGVREVSRLSLSPLDLDPSLSFPRNILSVHISYPSFHRPLSFLHFFATFYASTAWCSEIGSLTSLDACNSGASSDVRELISLRQAVCLSAPFPVNTHSLLSFTKST